MLLGPLLVFFGLLLPLGTIGLTFQEKNRGSKAELLDSQSEMDEMVNGHFRNLNWRYLPYIRPM
jgi:hypothetical protein